MSLITHRAKEDLGGLVYLLTIDMRDVTEDPTHVLRIVNSYGENGEGVTYQGVTYSPHPYELKEVTRSAKANGAGAKVTIADGEDYFLTRFIDNVGGDLQDAKIEEKKVYGIFLDNSPEANSLAFTKRLDHIVDYVEDSENKGEIYIHTIDPLSKSVEIPTKTFTAGTANGTVSAINIFPAADRNLVEDGS